MVYHILSYFIMVYHGLSWFIMVYHGLSWFIMVYNPLPHSQLQWIVIWCNGKNWRNCTDRFAACRSLSAQCLAECIGLTIFDLGDSCIGHNPTLQAREPAMFNVPLHFAPSVSRVVVKSRSHGIRISKTPVRPWLYGMFLSTQSEAEGRDRTCGGWFVSIFDVSRTLQHHFRNIPKNVKQYFCYLDYLNGIKRLWNSVHGQLTSPPIGLFFYAW